MGRMWRSSLPALRTTVLCTSLWSCGGSHAGQCPWLRSHAAMWTAACAWLHWLVGPASDASVGAPAGCSEGGDLFKTMLMHGGSLEEQWVCVEVRGQLQTWGGAPQLWGGGGGGGRRRGPGGCCAGSDAAYARLVGGGRARVGAHAGFGAGSAGCPAAARRLPCRSSPRCCASWRRCTA